jgi:hypothetical protein
MPFFHIASVIEKKELASRPWWHKKGKKCHNEKIVAHIPQISFLISNTCAWSAR